MDVSVLCIVIRERPEALGLHSSFADFSGLSRQTLVGLEVGPWSDLGFNLVVLVLSVLGLDLGPTSQTSRSWKGYVDGGEERQREPCP